MLKPGQFVKMINTGSVAEILSVTDDGYNIYFHTEKPSISVHYNWRESYFSQIAPEGFTLEEAKLYFAL